MAYRLHATVLIKALRSQAGLGILAKLLYILQVLRAAEF